MNDIKKTPDQQKLASQRTHLANERTLLAYVRTCLSMVGFGFIILRFDPSPNAPLLGYGFIIFSGVILIIGFWRFFVFRKKINSDNSPV